MALVNGKYLIADAFDVIVGSGDVKVAKPDPAIFHLTLAQLGRQPEEAIFVDDSPTNIQGAQAVGLHTIHYTRGTRHPRRPGALRRQSIAPFLERFLEAF